MADTALRGPGYSVDWCIEGRINIDDLITHQVPLDDINHAFDLMHAGESIRTVVRY